eukprot:6876231-Pyramimonas_sp.AAC.1
MQSATSFNPQAAATCFVPLTKQRKWGPVPACSSNGTVVGHSFSWHARGAAAGFVANGPWNFNKVPILPPLLRSVLTLGICCLRSCDWFSHWVYTASPPAIGSHA